MARERDGSGTWRQWWRRVGLVLGGALAAALLVLHGLPALFFHPPLANTAQTRFDAILVLGFPATEDGRPTPILRERVEEAVAAWHRGAADHLIVSGGAAHNAVVEADAMAELAETLGVPADRILRERESRNTAENLERSEAILRAHGWRSVLIVTSRAHVPRAAWLASRHAMAYAFDGARGPGLLGLLLDLAGTEWEHVQQIRVLLRNGPVPGAGAGGAAPQS